MRTHFARLRAALVLLLVGSGLLFAIGSTIERHQHHTEHHPAATAASGGSSAAAEATGESAGESAGESTGETRPAENNKPAVESHGEAGAKILGVNTESVVLMVIAVVASLLLALAVWLGRWPRLVLVCVAGFGLVFAAGDGRELVHQLDESNGGLAAIAAILIVLHLAVAVLAGALYPRGRKVSELAAAQPLG
jgi:hypothetical protein